MPYGLNNPLIYSIIAAKVKKFSFCGFLNNMVAIIKVNYSTPPYRAQLQQMGV